MRECGPSKAGIVVIGLLWAGTAVCQPVRGGFYGLFQLPAAVAPVLPRATPVRSCESLATMSPAGNTTVREALTLPGEDGTGEWCRVTIEVATPPTHSSSASERITHTATSPARNVITIWLMLPVQHWNGRFLGLGGGAWLAGFTDALNTGASLGFATAVTNAGRPYGLGIKPEELSRQVSKNDFLVDANGRLDWTALENFAHRGIHEMTVAGKAITAKFYGTEPRYAYFSGCSTGGRQGQSEVQRYPADYDGVLSGAPAINWAHFAMAEFWVRAVLDEHAVAQCKFDAAQQAALATCDGDDGAHDGLAATVGTCRFDPKQLVGKQTECGTIDAQDAEAIRRIWDGPRRRDGTLLWNGIDPTVLVHVPTGPAHWAAPFFEGKVPATDSYSVTAFENFFDSFVQRYGAVMDTSNPDLSAFAARGGKTLLWHGVADDVIPAAGTVHYVDSIRRLLGDRKTAQFLRFYLAPGVGHCSGGAGPQPVAMLAPLMEWVEHSRTPAAVPSENWDKDGVTTRTRPLCPYPEYARYRGRGSLDDAASFHCQK